VSKESLAKLVKNWSGRCWHKLCGSEDGLVWLVKDQLPKW